MNSYDVAVVGAGPAGATTAGLLARQGLSVALLEKEELPRYKACGGGLTGRAAKLLTEPPPADIVEDQTRRVTLTYRGRWPVTVTNPEPIVTMTMRSDLDHWMVQNAVDAGARLFEETLVLSLSQRADTVEVETSRGLFCAQVVIAADGVNSIVARQAGLAQTHAKALALEVELEVSDALLDKHHGAALLDYGWRPDGYAWIFPKRHHLSIGAGISTGGVDELRRRLALLRENNRLEGRVLLERGYYLSIGGGPRESVHSGRVLVVGDAAGLVDPLFGEGIYYAFRSARVAAEVVAEALETGGSPAQLTTVLDQYPERLRKDSIDELQSLHRFAEFFYRWSGFFHTAFVLRPRLLERVMKGLAGELPLTDALPLWRF